jgi:hypothetical protein
MLPIFDFLNVKQILLIQESTGYFAKIHRFQFAILPPQAYLRAKISTDEYSRISGERGIKRIWSSYSRGYRSQYSRRGT